jgi:hypothetical protein
MARLALIPLLLFALITPGCAALTQLAALHQVQFAFDRVSDVRVAGVLVSGKSGYGDASTVDLARLAAAVAQRSVPVDVVVHVRGTSPSENTVTARMLQFGWTFFVDDREVVDGQVNQTYLFEPGRPVDVQIPVRFNAYDKFGGGAKGLFELGLAIAGVGNYEREVRVDLVPTIETSLGPIRYPAPITLRRTVGG